MSFEGLNKIEDNIDQLERKAVDDLCAYYSNTQEYKDFTVDALRYEMLEKLRDVIGATLSYKAEYLKQRRSELESVKDTSSTEYIELERDTAELYSKELNFMRNDLLDKLMQSGIREQVAQGIVKAVVRQDIRSVK